MARKTDLPIMVGKNLNKGIMCMRSPKGFGGFDMYITWLDKSKEFESGTEFDLQDIESINAVIHFCDRESVETTIKVLQKVLKMWKKV